MSVLVLISFNVATHNWPQISVIGPYQTKQECLDVDVPNKANTSEQCVLADEADFYVHAALRKAQREFNN
jgi:hypothetical protein